MNKGSGYIDPDTVCVYEHYTHKWGVRAMGERYGEFKFDEWWIGSHGLPYSTALDTRDKSIVLFWDTKEEAEKLAEKLMGLVDTSGWNDHE